MSFLISDFFDLDKIEKIKESKTKVYFFTHKKTKAKILFFDNANENSGFSTFFKTPCENSKGTTHILEHSVFEGSRKYDQENSLDFILNNSLNSAFNAMTFLDKTGYYFCSSFPKDYMNLLDIYLDFVYFPKLELKTLRKEGHFFKKTDKGYEFNGIVFNEMKNSLLGFYSKFYDSINELFEQGSYSYIAGGNPIDVVDLTHDELVGYHKNHYHPSNSYTILYGKINKRKVFEKLNEVFSQFDIKKDEIILDVVPIKESKKINVSFQSTNDEDGLNFCKYYLLENLVNEEDYLSLDVAKHYLLSYDFSPLRRVLEDSGLCVSVEDMYLTEAKYPILAVLCRGVLENNIPKIEKLIDESLQKFSKNISTDIKKLIYKRYEFKLNEIEFYQNQAEDIMFSAAKFLNYGLDPLIGLRNSISLKKIKRTTQGKNLENFIKDNLLKAKTLSITFTPDKKLLEKYNSELEKKLELNLKKTNLEKLDSEIELHEKFLNKEKIEPKYSSLKKIKLQDLNLDVKKYSHKYSNNVFTSYLNSGEIIRTSFYFDICNFDIAMLPTLGIYLYIINQISTKSNKFDKLAFIKKSYFDQLNYGISYMFDHHQNKQLNLFYVAAKYLESDADKVSEIFKELVLDIDFTDKERIKYLLSEQLDSIKESIQENPLENSVQIAQSYLSPVDKINFEINSLPAMREIKKILADFENEFPILESNLNQIHKYIYSQNAICNFGISKEIEKYSTKHLEELVKKININLVSKDKLSKLNTDFFKFPDKSINLFYNSNSDTNFNVLGLKYSNLNSEDKSIIKILEPYMFQYLWENIRVKNGAYGAFWTLNKNYEYGVFGSYSDPKLNDTFKTYLNTKKKYDISKFKNYSFEKMKLKFLSKEKIIYRNANLYSNAFSYFIRGISDEEREKSLAKKIRINAVDFKSLIKNVLDYSFNIKVIATTTDRMKGFSEKYQEIDLN